jgi:hypothetical protein
MGPADRFWLRVNRRAATLEPDVISALLKALERLRAHLDTPAVARLVAANDVDGVIRLALSDQTMDAAFAPLRAAMQQVTASGVGYFAKDVPGGALGIAFDVLAPTVVPAIRAIDTKVIGGLKTEIRETVRAFIENGLRDGVSPSKTARTIRQVVGIGPTQEQIVRNLRAELETGKFADAARRKMLDRRFKLANLDKLSAADRAKRIDLIVSAYRKRYLALNAETVAHTATLDSFKLGQQLAWQSAVDRGIVDGGRLTKTWHGVLDSRERPEHVVMEGERVPFNGRYSNGEFTPGDSTYGCRCLSVFRVIRPQS